MGRSDIAIVIPAFNEAETIYEVACEVEKYGEEINRSLLEISLAWFAKRKMVASVLVGATSAEQMIQNIEAISWTMSDEEMKKIDQIILG